MNLTNNIEPMAHEANASVEQRLRGAWRRERRFVHLRGLCHVLIAAALLSALALALDWMLVFAAPGRLALWIICIGGLLAVGYSSWWRHLQLYQPVHTALKVERLYPQLQSVLVSHVQLADEAPADGGISRGLIRAMSQQAVEQVRSLDFRRIVDFGALRGVAIACLAALALALAGGISAPQIVRTFLMRMTHPTARIGYPTRTSLVVLTQKHTIAEGDAVTLSAQVGGELPADAVLTLMPEGGEQETVRLPLGQQSAAGTRDVTHPMSEVYRTFSYTFRAGDAVSERLTVTVVPPPRIEPRIVVTAPPYTGQPPQEYQSLSAEVLEGSALEWRLTSDRPLAKAEIIPDGGRPMAMNVSADGLAIHFQQTPSKTFSYTLRWTDREHGFVFAPATRHIIKIVPDTPPRVVLKAPLRDEKGLTQKTLAITFAASDVQGLVSARLVYAVEGRGGSEADAPVEKSVPIRQYDNQREAASETFRWPAAGTVTDLKPGDVIRYAVEVTDSRPATPGKTRSETRRLSIVTKEEYLQYVQEEQNRLFARIKELHGEETRALEAIRQLAAPADGVRGANQGGK